MKAYLNKLLISVLMVAISLMLILPCFCIAEEPDDNPEPELCPSGSWTFLDANEPAPELCPSGSWTFLDVNEPAPENY